MKKNKNTFLRVTEKNKNIGELNIKILKTKLSKDYKSTMKHKDHVTFTPGKIESIKGMFSKFYLFEIELIQIEMFQLDPLTNRLFGKFDLIKKGKCVILSKLYEQSCHIVPF